MVGDPARPFPEAGKELLEVDTPIGRRDIADVDRVVLAGGGERAQPAMRVAQLMACEQVECLEGHEGPAVRLRVVAADDRPERPHVIAPRVHEPVAVDAEGHAAGRRVLLRVLFAAEQGLSQLRLAQPLVHAIVEVRQPARIGRALEDLLVGVADDAGEVRHRLSASWPARPVGGSASPSRAAGLSGGRDKPAWGRSPR